VSFVNFLKVSDLTEDTSLVIQSEHTCYFPDGKSW
jgi:hypothetical protein